MKSPSTMCSIQAVPSPAVFSHQARGSGTGVGPGQPPQQPISKGDQLNMLKSQAEAVRKQLEEIDRRIKELGD